MNIVFQSPKCIMRCGWVSNLGNDTAERTDAQDRDKQLLHLTWSDSRVSIPLRFAMSVLRRWRYTKLQAVLTNNLQYLPLFGNETALKRHQNIKYPFKSIAMRSKPLHEQDCCRIVWYRPNVARVYNSIRFSAFQVDLISIATCL